MMPRLFMLDTKQLIGEISKNQLQFLLDQLVKEDPEDKDYYLNRDMLEILREEGADEQLIAMLEQAMGDKEDLDIVWED